MSSDEGFVSKDLVLFDGLRSSLLGALKGTIEVKDQR